MHAIEEQASYSTSEEGPSVWEGACVSLFLLLLFITLDEGPRKPSRLELSVQAMGAQRASVGIQVHLLTQNLNPEPCARNRRTSFLLYEYRGAQCGGGGQRRNPGC